MQKIDIDNFELINIDKIIKTNEYVSMTDIQIEQDQTFFLETNILTHNSAIASFTEIRDPETQAGMPLRGKVLNVYGKAPLKAMENDEISDIITALNLEFNEQMGDWVIPNNYKLYKVVYRSVFEVNDMGEPLTKEVTLLNTDRFLIDKRWVQIQDLINLKDSYYIMSINELSSRELDLLSPPDYFHFRRLWDFRGFRKKGVPYKVKIGRNTMVCNDIDSILVDKKWVKVVNLLKVTPENITIDKVSSESVLTRYNKKLRPSFNSTLKYAAVHISTDADPDGSAINNLFVNVLHEYFPELYWDDEYAFVNRIIFPMISAQKGKKTKYYANRTLFDQAKETNDIDETWKITYFKGLGSMTMEDWEHVFSNLDKYTFPIIDDGYLDELMQIFFDDVASIRKEWLSTP